jgi:uncharacterized repeat protein (TIGR04138 family)
MPTMDLDAGVLGICRRDPRFRAEAYHFLLEALDHTLARRGMTRASAGGPAAASTPGSTGDPSPAAVEGPATADAMAAARGASIPPPVWNVTGRDLLEGFRDLALDRFGGLAREVLRSWGITRTGDVGSVVFNMVEGGLLQRTATDSPADYHEVFDFETAFDIAFADRLRKEEIRLADRPPG